MFLDVKPMVFRRWGTFSSTIGLYIHIVNTLQKVVSLLPLSSTFMVESFCLLLVQCPLCHFPSLSHFKCQLGRLYNYLDYKYELIKRPILESWTLLILLVYNCLSKFCGTRWSINIHGLVDRGVSGTTKPV